MQTRSNLTRISNLRSHNMFLKKKTSKYSSLRRNYGSKMDSDPNPDSRIKINVGGTIFETTKQTLSGAAYFRSLFNNWTMPTSEPYFIDRSAMLFQHVLCLLYDTTYPYPSDYLGELDFYGIDYKLEGPLPVPQSVENVSLGELIPIIALLKSRCGLCSTLKCPFPLATVRFCAYCSSIGPKVLFYIFLRKDVRSNVVVRYQDKLWLINCQGKRSDDGSYNFDFSSPIEGMPSYSLPFNELTLPTYEEADIWLKTKV